METVKLEKLDNIAVVTISRPSALNALNSQVVRELGETFDAIDKDEDIYVVILTGDGRSFVAGADIGEMKDFDPCAALAFGELGNDVFFKIESCTKPVIAAINGFALGGGCELAMSCDIRIAGEKAKFGQPEVGLGITPGFGGTQRLPRIVGISRAMELILTAKIIGAAEALSMGLVSKVVPQEELMGEAMSLAKAIAANAQIAVRQSKRCIRRGMQTDIRTACAFESEAFGVCCGTEDQKDAMTAFVEKRKLDGFKNR